jgi:hypothetical protein
MTNRFSLALIGSIIFWGAIFSEAMSKNTTSEIAWALYEKPLLVAVEVDGYNGDILTAGDYRVEVRSYDPRNAEVFDVIVANRELSLKECFSIIKDAYSEHYKSKINPKIYSHYGVGGMAGIHADISLARGQYVHVIPSEFYSLKTDRSFESRELSGILYLSKK